MSFRPDVMTPTQRIEALYRREPVDHVPFIHRGYGFSSKNVGYAISDTYADPEKSFYAQLWTAEQYGSDATPFYTFVAYGAWEFGGEIAYPQDRYESGPYVVRRPITDVEDLWKLELPDPAKAGCVPMMLQFARLQAKHNLPIAFICGSPFTHAANLCGVQEFLTWLIDKPEAAHRALRLMTDHILQVAKLFVDEFGKGRVMGRSAAPTESNYLISPKHFQEFALPYLKELHEKVLDMGVKNIYCHICGEQNANLKYWAQIPFGETSMLSFGHEVDLLTAAEYFPQHIIAGNVDPQIIANGTPEEIYQKCREAIEKGKQIKSGYVLMAGCEIPHSTPPYHMWLMRKAVDEFGWYM